MGGKIDIQIKHREKVLELRRLDRLIQSDEFSYIWCRVTQKEKDTASFFIWLGEYNHFKKWMQTQLDLGYKLYSVKDLRTLASKYHVPYYSRKAREELIEALTEKGILDGNTSEALGRNEATPGCSWS